jgi:hypothetical protein
VARGWALRRATAGVLGIGSGRRVMGGWWSWFCWMWSRLSSTDWFPLEDAWEYLLSVRLLSFLMSWVLFQVGVDFFLTTLWFYLPFFLHMCARDRRDSKSLPAGLTIYQSKVFCCSPTCSRDFWERDAYILYMDLIILLTRTVIACLTSIHSTAFERVW